MATETLNYCGHHGATARENHGYTLCADCATPGYVADLLANCVAYTSLQRDARTFEDNNRYLWSLVDAAGLHDIVQSQIEPELVSRYPVWAEMPAGTRNAVKVG